MAVQTTQLTKIYASWGDPLEDREIEELNHDLEKMDIPLKVVYEPGDDGWGMTFIKDEDR